MPRLLHLSDILRSRTQHISVVSKAGVCAWTRYHGELRYKLVGDGDFILDLYDVRAATDFVAGGVLDRWADELDFSLNGFDRREVFFAIAAATLRPAWTLPAASAA